MKAVIFSCSIKDKKNSETQAWCELVAKRMKMQSIECTVVNLKDFDHEASTGPDLLHEEMAKVYDANFIVIAGPVNFNQPSFFLRNLAKRFVHAHQQAKRRDINIFENKLFEICIMQGCFSKYLQDGTEIPDVYNGGPTRTMKALMPQPPALQYIQPMQPPLHVSFSGATDRRGPTRKNLHTDTGTLKDIDLMIDKFKRQLVRREPAFSNPELPTFGQGTWMKCFASNDPNAFGRGYTLSKDNLTEENVSKHIKWINDNIENALHRAQIWVAMKERCVKNDFHDGADMYFDEQFHLGQKGMVKTGEMIFGDEYILRWKKGSFRIQRPGNYRPNNY